MLEQLKKQVFEANMYLHRNKLVLFTWGNVSGIDREKGLVVIKPSGVPYDALSFEDMVVVGLNGHVEYGRYLPSSDTPTHLELYKAFADIGGVCHTHSKYAASRAQAGLPIPCYGTTHADYFYGEIPCTEEMVESRIAGEYEKETGLMITERFADLDYHNMKAVLVRSHGPFTWGKNPADAAEASMVLECTAEMAYITETSCEYAGRRTEPVSNALLNKHFLRKHGKNAYYGQK